MNQINNFWVGLMIGATIPVIGFWMLENIFGLMASLNIIDEVTAGSLAKRQRTLSLIAIACNLLFVNFFKSRKYDDMVKGILIASFIYSGFWVYYYHSALFV